MKHNLQLLITALAFLALGGVLARYLMPVSDGGSDASCIKGEPFMPFLQRFNDDLTFQKQRTLFPLAYKTPYELSDDTMATYLIERASWVPITIYDSTATIIQVAFDEDASGNPDPCSYRVSIDGIHHGLQLVLYFTQQENSWYLSAFEDRSK